MKKHQLAAGIALASSMIASPFLQADSNPFSHTELQSGFNYNEPPAAGHEGKGEGEGKCGAEGKCGEGMTDGEGHHDGHHDGVAGDGKKCPEGKCGEGKCGEGKCGGDKCPEGTCGGESGKK